MSERNLDSLLREWADLGDERLPERYLRAALDEIDTTPQRGARWASLEGFLMRLQPAAPLLGIAAVVIAAIALYATVFRPNVGDPSPSNGPAPTMVSGTYETSSFAVPFRASLESAASADGWAVVEEPTMVTFSPEAGSGYDVVILRRSSSSLVTAAGAVPVPDELVAALDGLEGLAAAGISRPDLDAPFELTIAGTAVPVIEIEVSGGSTPADVFQTPDGVIRRPMAAQTWWLFDADHADLLVIYRGADLSRWFGTVAALLESLELEGSTTGRHQTSAFGTWDLVRDPRLASRSARLSTW